MKPELQAPGCRLLTAGLGLKLPALPPVWSMPQHHIPRNPESRAAVQSDVTCLAADSVTGFPKVMTCSRDTANILHSGSRRQHKCAQYGISR